ncbi:MAG TPA: rhomboid family intramembrane serine protease [Chitinophagaceae bacterium]|nr:rhomboid family intramembrane serine protease [Chitinophagaceae bacterium]
MSYYEKEYKRRLSLGQDGNALVMLIAINLVIFVLFAFVKVIYYFSYDQPAADINFGNDIYNNLALPASLHEFVKKPWTLITHMFYHYSVWHIISNMLWLWAFGYIFQDLTGSRKIIPVYIYGALAGAIAFVGAFHVIPTLKEHIDNANAVGASAGIMAIAIATTTIAPGYRIFPMLSGGIPLWVLTMIFLIIDLATIPGANSGGHIAHLAGALAGYLFIYTLRKGYDGSEWMNNFYDWFNNLFNPSKPAKRKKVKQELFYKSKTQPFTKTPNLTQQKVDEILDKINQKGYSHLTEEEKELLKRASKEDL